MDPKKEVIMLAINYLLLVLCFLLQSCTKQETIAQIEKPSETELFRSIHRGIKNPHGASLSVVNGESTHFEAKDFPAGSIFHLAIRGSLGEIRYISSYQADKKGNLISPPGKKTISDMPLREDFGDYYLIADDGTTVIWEKVDQDAIELKAKNGATLRMKRSDFQGESYILQLEGFAPEEKILYVSISGDEVMQTEESIDAEGGLNIMSSPGILATEGGIARIEIIRESGEKFIVDYPWGVIAGKVSPIAKID